ncbi:MAG: NHL repeat-containing protein [Chloroflexota bacterium]
MAEPVAAAQGDIITVAGGGTLGDNNPATDVLLDRPWSVMVDDTGNWLITQSYQNAVRNVDTNGMITTIAGTGTKGGGGDNGAATNAQLAGPRTVAMDDNGNRFISDTDNNRIRKIDTNGIITTVAGNGAHGYGGDNGPATIAQLRFPGDVIVDAGGNLIIADMHNHRIRKVDTNGIITTIAGTGIAGYSGDNGLATDAQLTYPHTIILDNDGNLIIADTNNNRIRKVDTNGVITTIAGNGTDGYSGDNGPAIDAQLGFPHHIVLDGNGNLFIADTNNNRVRKVDTDGIISTIVGTGDAGYSGDNGPAIDAQLNYPTGLSIDSSGNLLIADSNNNRVRLVKGIAVPSSEFEGEIETPIELDPIIVDTDSDDGSKSSCDDAVAEDCSLRGAIQKVSDAAENSNAAHKANATQSTYVIQLSDTITTEKTIVVSGRTLEITADVTIQGRNDAGGSMVVDGGNSVRVFTISDGAAVTLDGLTVQNGTGDIRAGGIWVRQNATLWLLNSTVRNNEVTVGIFGGPQANGAGITNEGAGSTVHVRNSTIHDNVTPRRGGGIFSGGTLTVVNSTINGNSAGFTGGGIHVQGGPTSINHTTISDNVVTAGQEDGGSGLYVVLDTAIVDIQNSIIAYGDDDDIHCVIAQGARVNDNGYNMIEDGTCLSSPTSLSGDPMLDTLNDNGGTTLTHRLGKGSQAVDAIPNGTNGCGTLGASDQLGTPRPMGNGNCDIGAIEATFPTSLPWMEEPALKRWIYMPLVLK